MKKALELLLHLDDHKHDALGHVFLDPADARETQSRLRSYLGPKIVVKGARVEGPRLRVRVELPDFQAESDNLVRLARELLGRKRPHAAVDQLREALKIFPLNGAALKGLGRASYEAGDYGEAITFFVRANEVLREDGEALRALGTIALSEGREASALAYYQRAVQANPDDETAARALGALRDRIAQRFEASTGPATGSPKPAGRPAPRPRGR